MGIGQLSPSFEAFASPPTLPPADYYYYYYIITATATATVGSLTKIEKVKISIYCNNKSIAPLTSTNTVSRLLAKRLQPASPSLPLHFQHPSVSRLRGHALSVFFFIYIHTHE